MGGIHWTSVIVKGNKSYFDISGGTPDEFLQNQLPEPIIYQFYKIQNINARLRGSYCLYFL